jgi:hypothetical protein
MAKNGCFAMSSTGLGERNSPWAGEYEEEGVVRLSGNLIFVLFEYRKNEFCWIRKKSKSVKLRIENTVSCGARNIILEVLFENDNFRASSHSVCGALLIAFRGIGSSSSLF